MFRYLITLAIFVSTGFGQVPKTISYQGVLTDGSDNVVADGIYKLKFELHSTATNGNIPWQETHENIPVINGVFNVILGSITPLIVPFDEPYFLAISVNDGERLEPFTPLTASPYTLGIADSIVTGEHISENQVVRSLNGLTDSLTIVGGENIGVTVTGSNLIISTTGAGVEGDITSVIAGEGLTGGGDEGDVKISLADSGVTSSKIANNQLVRSVNALTDALTLAGEGGAVVSTRNDSIIINAGVGGEVNGIQQIQSTDSSLAVTNATGPVTTVNINTSGVSTDKIANGAITVEKLADGLDASDSNEIQSMALSGNTLSLSKGGGSISLASFGSPWNNSGSNLYFNTGKVGIGDNSPVATLTVGNGDKTQIHGSDGDIVLKDDQGSLRFANSNGSNAPMIHMFQSGTNNSTRMFVAHSPSFPSWGIQYNDTSDAFTYIGDNLPSLHVQLSGQKRIGIGTRNPEAKLHVLTNSSVGVGHLKLTEGQFDYSRITMNNDEDINFWEIAARTDENLANAQFNIYHSDVGNILSVNARGRVGINDASPAFALEVNGNGESRTINVRNTLPATTTSTFSYGVMSNLSQSAHTGFPRLFNIYGFSTDADSYLSYGVYGFASNASNFNYGVYGVATVDKGYAVYSSGNTYSTGSYLPSDVKLKSNLNTYNKGLEKIMALKPRTYAYDTHRYGSLNLPEGQQCGLLAHEVKSVLPHLVKRSFQPYDEPKSDTQSGQGIEFEALNYTGFIPELISAIQEQQKQIEELKKKISVLESLQ